MLQKYDSKNDAIKVWVDGELVDREAAKVSVFDSVVQGGDAVWEGLRVYDGKIFSLDYHLDRLLASAHALDFKNIPTRERIVEAIFKTLNANEMDDNVHIRLTLTRGRKITSGMDPRLNRFGCTLIVLAEWKSPVYTGEISLITSSIRRNAPMFLDSKIHHNNLLNNILAKIEANYAGADEAIMLDMHGFVAECNSVNIFMVKDKTVYTPHADSCLPGITRKLVLEICKQNEIEAIEKNLSIAEFITADEVFVSGTMGELTRVVQIDGRIIHNQSDKSILDRLKKEFMNLTENYGTKIPATTLPSE